VVWGSGPSHRWRGPSGWEVAPWFGEVVPATGGVGQVVPSHRWRGPSDAQPQVAWAKRFGKWPLAQVAWAKWCPNSQSPQKGDFGVLALLLVPPPSSVVGCGGGVGGTFSQ
jgi:hypothetical protein